MRVFISRPVPQGWLHLLHGKVDYEIFPEDRLLSKEELKRHLSEVDGAIVILADKIDKEVMDAAPNLRVISNYAVGYDNIDIEEATRRKIMVTNTPDVLTNATAELALALLFAVARRVVEGDRFTREGRFEGWSPVLLLGTEIKGKTVGVIGAGRIGREFAKKAYALGMKVIYYSRTRKEALDKIGAEFVSLEELLRRSDFISIHLPLTPETHHLIGKKEIEMMKPDAILINTGRGAVIDEMALADALKRKRIKGAGLDVYEFEPGITRILLELENVVLTPHIGSATEETRKRMMEVACENLLCALEGKTPPNLVNPEVLS
mgnify:CR=1 FL=1